MNVISWENGDAIITDFPSCSDPLLARMVQIVNDVFANPITGMLDAPVSMKVLDLGHATVGTAYHKLSPHQMSHVYYELEKLLRFESRRHMHLVRSYDQRDRLLYGMPGGYVSSYWYDEEHLEWAEQQVVQSFESYVNIFSRYGNSGIVQGAFEQNEVLNITDHLISRFKRLTHVEDIVTPIEKTKEAVEKMLVLV